MTGLTATQDVGLHHAQVESGRRGDRLPDRAHAGRRQRRADGAATVVGVWQPQRTITPRQAGVRGLGLQAGRPLPVARARALRHRHGRAAQAVLGRRSRGATLGHPGPAELLTAWEKRDTAATEALQRPYTTDGRGGRRSPPRSTPRATACGVVELTRTIQNRPMDLYIIGYPKPPDTAAEISAKPTYCGQLQRARQRGLRPRVVLHDGAPARAPPRTRRSSTMLSKMTVLIMPSINPDGRAHNTRGNTTGQDLNRDHALIEQAETKGSGADDPRLHAGRRRSTTTRATARTCRSSPRATSTSHEPLFEEGKSMVIEWMYGAAATVGLVDGPVQHRRRQPRGHPAQHRRR